MLRTREEKKEYDRIRYLAKKAAAAEAKRIAAEEKAHKEEEAKEKHRVSSRACMRKRRAKQKEEIQAAANTNMRFRFEGDGSPPPSPPSTPISLTPYQIEKLEASCKRLQESDTQYTKAKEHSSDQTRKGLEQNAKDLLHVFNDDSASLKQVRDEKRKRERELQNAVLRVSSVPSAPDSAFIPQSPDPKARPVAATGAVGEADDYGKKPAAVELDTQPNSSPTVPVTENVCLLICPKCEARNSDECATCLNCGNTLFAATRISTAGEEEFAGLRTASAPVPDTTSRNKRGRDGDDWKGRNTRARWG